VTDFDNKPGYAALRQNRYSVPGAEYFLTLNTLFRKEGLCSPESLAKVSAERQKLESLSFWHVRCAVVMPDHMHLLVELGAKKSVQEVVRLFKGRLSSTLRLAGLHWQDGYYEHRMRQNEKRLPVFIYIFLNPYKAKLIAATKAWAGYYCDSTDWAWFSQFTDNELPMPEWLQ
jgi:putative transposase